MNNASVADVLINTAKQIAAHFKLCYTQSQVESILISHPLFPNVVALRETLLNWNIFSLLVELNEEQLHKSSYPFVAAVSGNKWMLVISSNDSSIKINDSGKIKTLPKNDFLKIWSGVCLLLAATNGHDEGKYRAFMIRNHLVFSLNIVAAVALVGMLVFNVMIFSLTFCSLIGIYLSYHSVLIQDQQSSSPFCNDHQTCKHLSDSQFVRPFHFIRLASFSLAYFVLALLVIPLTIYARQPMEVLVAIASIGLGMACVSMVIQAYSRMFCRICIALVGVLIIQATLLIYFASNTLTVFMVFFYCGLLALSILLLASLIDNLFDNKKLELLALRNSSLATHLKNQAQVIKSLLLNSPRNRVSLDLTPAHISCGAMDSKHTLVLVIDAQCPSCESALHDLATFYNGFSSYVRLKIVLTYLHTKEVATELVNKLKTLFGIPIEHFSINATWSANELEQFISKSNIVYTPVLYVDDYKWPDILKISDVKYFLASSIYE